MNKVINFWELAEELCYEEKGKTVIDKWIQDSEYVDKFKSYREGKIKYFKELFGDRYKNKDGIGYLIPVKEKEIVKTAILGYTKTKFYKSIRNNKIPSLDSINEFINNLRVAADKSELDVIEKEELLSTIYTICKINSSNVAARCLKDTQEMMEKEFEELTAFHKEGKDLLEAKREYSNINLNEDDIICLILYYKQQIKRATENWRGIVEIMSELRQQDILDVCDKQCELEEDGKDTGTYWDHAKDSYQILLEAVDEYYGGTNK